MAPSAMKPTVDICPDLETLAAYLDGRLTERERAAVAEHLAGCESCYFVFTEAAQTRPSQQTQTHPSKFPQGLSGGLPEAEQQTAKNARWTWLATPRMAWSSAVGLAAAASLALAVGAGVIPWRSESSELRALVAAVGTDRTIEPRLTGFGYGPLRGAFRGRDPVAPALTPEVRIAAANVERRELGRRTPRALRTLALAYIVSHDIDRAIAVLEGAAEQSSSDAPMLSDLAAAYLVRATRMTISWI